MTAETKKDSILIIHDKVETGELLKLAITRKFPTIDPERIFMPKGITDAWEYLREGVMPEIIVTNIETNRDGTQAGLDMIDQLRQPDSPYKDIPILIFSTYNYESLNWEKPEKTTYLQSPATFQEIQAAVDETMRYAKEPLR